MAVLERVYREHGSPVDRNKIDLTLEAGLAECRSQGVWYPPIILRRKADMQRGKFDPIVPVEPLREPRVQCLSCRAEGGERLNPVIWLEKHYCLQLSPEGREISGIGADEPRTSQPVKSIPRPIPIRHVSGGALPPEPGKRYESQPSFNCDAKRQPHEPQNAARRNPTRGFDAKGGWVPLPEIQRHAAQYNSRLFEIRRLGFTVENRTERDENGNVLSWYRLLLGVPAQPLSPAADPPQLDTQRTSIERDSTEWLPF